MNSAIFLLGGNSGDRFRILFAAIHELRALLGTPLNSSSFYLTEPWGNKDQPWFLNATISFGLRFNPLETLQKVLQIEQKFGRVRTEKWGPRTLDIDLLYHGNTVLTDRDLILPHPGIPERKFTLEPLAEMCPDYVHPLTRTTHRNMLHANTGNEIVYKL